LIKILGVNINEVLDNINQDIVRFLIILDLIIIFISLYLSYYLAWKTLKPIKNKIEEQNKFIADVSHELRNPLSAIKLTADSMMSEKSYNKKDTKEVFSDISSESKRLIKMSEWLLNIIKNKDNTSYKDIVNISNIFNDNIKVLSSKIKQKNIEINIEKKDIKKIFNRFYKVDNSRTFDYNGTWLGLSIVKNLISKNNLDIEVKSKIGKGSEFIINF